MKGIPKYIVKGDFHNFRYSSAFTDRELNIHDIIWNYTQSSPFYHFRDFHKSGIRLHGQEGLVMDYYGGMILFLHIPPLEHQRVNELLCKRDLYINWTDGDNQFHSFTVKLTSITEQYNKSEVITLDDLINNGEILQPLPLISIEDVNYIAGAKAMLNHLSNSFYIACLILRKHKRWFRTKLFWDFQIQYIQQTNEKYRQRR